MVQHIVGHISAADTVQQQDLHHPVAEGGLGLLGVPLENIKHSLVPELSAAEAPQVTRLASLLLSHHPSTQPMTF